MPPAPDHFSRCSAINRKGPALIRNLPKCVPIDPASFYKRSLKKNTIVLDIRSYDAFGGQHVPGSYNIDFGGNFATFAGWILPADHDIILVAYSPHGSSEALVWLRRVGLDRTIGFLDGGMHEWAKAGLPIETVFQMSAKELQTRIKNMNAPFIIDVRAKGEYDAYHIDGSVNIPVPDLRTRHDELGTYKEIAVICNTGLRSSLAASILKRKLNKNIYNIPGGMTAWNAAGQGPECILCSKPHGPQNL
jgi:rhodanese-related sulfurtransferase